ncbi:MAG: twin-arginine translocase subunit TatC [Actinobacteria bacterium]|nr:MAG: twin-arginine translocase subunit TatC [Actinomycetota bacterium]
MQRRRTGAKAEAAIAVRESSRRQLSPPAPDTGMTLIEHLTELRRRIVISVAAVAVGGIVAFALYNRILDFLIEPYCQLENRPPGPCTLFITDPLEGFATRLKVATWSGFFLASPVVLFQLWRFVTPGLNPNEKRYAVPFVASSVVLFFFGAVLAKLTFPQALDFLVSVGGPNLETIFSPAKYLRLVILITISFGVAFQFPVLLVFLQLAGALSSRRLAGWRRPAVVVVFIVAAVITPSQDPYTLLFMAGPMYVFYELSILVGKLLRR